MGYMYTEMDKLVEELENRGCDYSYHTLFDGYQVVVYDSETGEYLWDAICHSGSYGHEKGLLEIMGSIVDSYDDDVEGYLTAEDILERID